MKKQLFLVGSPPASGKTYVAKKIAKRLDNPVYLDKDVIIPLSKAAYLAADEPYSRDSVFFNQYIRDVEYIAILDVAFEALAFNDHVILNAPFTKEFRNASYIEALKQRLAPYEAELVMIWVHCDLELIHERMKDRNSERDKWKLENWEAYIKTKDNSIPELEGLITVENKDEDTVDSALDELFKKTIQ
ncbi:MAG: Zeta toxin family protein [Clostridia bacterium]|jgi:adenylate kinase family enzyme|nr:Zeta toxin family protein [Clostridia bacterium]